MSTFAIGDIQGCYREFKKLLSEINFNKTKDTLCLTGDLVNRGPNSLDVLKYIMDLGSKAITVLGNHDFYLIASYYKSKPWPYKNNSFDGVLTHKDCDIIIDWLKKRKIIHIDEENKIILVHAGIHPVWKLDDINYLSLKIEESMQSPECEEFVKSLWSNDPNKWNNELTIKEKLIFSVNAFTRMRYLYNDLSLEFTSKNNPKKLTKNKLKPWYEFDNEVLKKNKIIIGHWSTLGFQIKKNIISIDTGCAWGNKLTAIKVDDVNNIKKYQINC